MPGDVLRAAVIAARDIGFPRITFSGGEPTLLNNLPDYIETVRTLYPTCTLGLVTNGYGLGAMWRRLREHLDYLDITILSLKRTTYRRFTQVPPGTILRLLGKSTPRKPLVTINCVVIDENSEELKKIVRLAQENRYSLTLMVSLPLHQETPTAFKAIERIIKSQELTDIKVSSTPVLERSFDAQRTLRIKLPFLSGLIQWNQCGRCSHRSRCGEFFCAIRIYPDGSVSSCRLKISRRKARTPNEMKELLSASLHRMVGEFKNWTDLVPWTTQRLPNVRYIIAEPWRAPPALYALGDTSRSTKRAEGRRTVKGSKT